MSLDFKGVGANLILVILGAIMLFPSIMGMVSFGFNITYLFMAIVGALFFFIGLAMLISGKSVLDK